MTSWHFEADFYTACNCDWGCPCTFNARPTEGHCRGLAVYDVRDGRFGETPLGGTRFGAYYMFPGRVEQGGGIACAYVDARATPAQREALEAIATGRAGGGIFELFAQLAPTWLPTRPAAIEFAIVDGVGRVSVDGIGEAASELLTYPDGSTIRPSVDLPHGIEFKRGLMTNTRRWWWNDAPLLATYENKYGAVAHVRFTQDGCVG